MEEDIPRRLPHLSAYMCHDICALIISQIMSCFFRGSYSTLVSRTARRQMTWTRDCKSCSLIAPALFIQTWLGKCSLCVFTNSTCRRMIAVNLAITISCTLEKGKIVTRKHYDCLQPLLHMLVHLSTSCNFAKLRSNVKRGV